METSDLIQLVALLVAITVLVFTILNNKKLLKLNFFAEYTKRYQDIMINFPNAVFNEDFDYSDSGEQKEQMLRYMRAYFDLCSEEYYMFTQGHVDDDIWENWKEGMLVAFKRKAFIDAWKNTNKENYKDFSKWISKELLSPSSRI